MQTKSVTLLQMKQIWFKIVKCKGVCEKWRPLITKKEFPLDTKTQNYPEPFAKSGTNSMRLTKQQVELGGGESGVQDVDAIWKI